MVSTINRRWREQAAESGDDIGPFNGPPVSMMDQEVPFDPLKWLLIISALAFFGAFAYLALVSAAAEYHWHIGHYVYFFHRN
jgi:hypothetical protein